MQLVLAGQHHAVSVLQAPTHHYQVQAADGSCDVELHAVQLSPLEDHHSIHGDVDFSLQHVRQHAVFVREADTLWMQWQGQVWQVHDQTRAASAKQQGGPSDGKLRAAMNGRVVALAVAVGDRVLQGQTVLTLEAMKMEHVHVAPASGVVKSLNVAVGEQVAASRVVAEIEMNTEGPT